MSAWNACLMSGNFIWAVWLAYGGNWFWIVNALIGTALLVQGVANAERRRE